MSINIEDLDDATMKKLGLSRPRKTSFTKEDVRSNALRVLHAIASLTRDQRRRVLEHAIRVNKA
jgi:hypothetical protein